MVVTERHETPNRRLTPRVATKPARRAMPGAAWSHWWNVLPLSLVVLALVGSVLIPARQTWLISKLLRETTEVLGPARVLEAELQSGLAEEIGALQSFAMSADTAVLEQYRRASDDDDQRVARLEKLVAHVDGLAAARLVTVKRALDEWRRLGDSVIEERGSQSEIAAAVAAGQESHRGAVLAVADLASQLGAAASERDVRVAQLENVSLMANAALVLTALAALSAVGMLTIRQRRLAGSLHQRVEEESVRARQEHALRAAAEALAGAFTIDEVTHRIAYAALEAVEGHGAFVERIVTRPGDASKIVAVEAVAGTRVPPLGATCGFAGSYAERVSTTGEPLLVRNLGELDRLGTVGTLGAVGGSTIIVPLGSSGAPIGALFIVSARDHFRANDVARATIFGQLAALAYEKVKLIDEANEGRRKLERAMSSRSRIMRGFSHDVKNPIGAADGYADLLSAGVYGELKAEQQESVNRIRRCIQTALSLIDDLHDLARAETGHLPLSIEETDLADVVRTIGEEYQAAARAAGLALSVSVDSQLPVVQTSKARIRQIASNLLSNAIKYTESGSVTVRALHHAAGPDGESGDWAAIEFADTGCGMPSDKLEFIFEEFSRIGQREKQGAGLGLAISRLLTEALGGRISVHSELGVGSTFTLWLPLRTRTSEMAVAAPASMYGDLRADQASLTLQ